MAISYSQGKLPTTVTDNNVDIPIIDPTKWEEDRSGFLSSNNVRQARYVYADGDKGYEMTLTVRVTLDNPRDAEAQQHVSIKLTTRQLIADSVAGTTLIGKRISYFIGWEIPLENTVTTAELRLGLGSIYGATCDGIASGVPGNGHIERIGRLLPNLTFA